MKVFVGTKHRNKKLWEQSNSSVCKVKINVFDALKKRNKSSSKGLREIFSWIRHLQVKKGQFSLECYEWSPLLRRKVLYSSWENPSENAVFEQRQIDK